jgi:hypothetical protein
MAPAPVPGRFTFGGDAIVVAESGWPLRDGHQDSLRAVSLETEKTERETEMADLLQS